MINLFHYKAKSDFKQKFICFDWTLSHNYNYIYVSNFNNCFTYHNYLKVLAMIELDCLCFI